METEVEQYSVVIIELCMLVVCYVRPNVCLLLPDCRISKCMRTGDNCFQPQPRKTVEIRLLDRSLLVYLLMAAALVVHHQLLGKMVRHQVLTVRHHLQGLAFSTPRS